VFSPLAQRDRRAGRMPCALARVRLRSRGAVEPGAGPCRSRARPVFASAEPRRRSGRRPPPSRRIAHDADGTGAV